MRTYEVEGSSGVSFIHEMMASNRALMRGRFPARTIISPRLMSTSSAVVRTTDSPAAASSSGPSGVSTAATRVLTPLGSATIRSPGPMVPDAIRPA